jgi:hypothetical protein
VNKGGLRHDLWTYEFSAAILPLTDGPLSGYLIVNTLNLTQKIRINGHTNKQHIDY